MALPWLQRAELALFAAAFLCGAVAAAALTRTQVRLRGGVGWREVGVGRRGGGRAGPDARPLLCGPGRLGPAGAGRRKWIDADGVLWLRLPRTCFSHSLGKRTSLLGVTYSTRHGPVSWLLLHNLTLVLKQVGPGPAFLLKSDTTVLSYAKK